MHKILARGLVSEIGSLATTGETSRTLIEILPPFGGCGETSQLTLLRETKIPTSYLPLRTSYFIMLYRYLQFLGYLLAFILLFAGVLYGLLCI